MWINLLSFNEEDRFSRNPDLLTELIAENSYTKVIIDEVQKVPKILDIVQIEIEKNKNIQFVLTGSSARKLKKGMANMLAGRLFTFSLHPFTHLELKAQFDLDSVLQLGSSIRRIKDIFHEIERYFILFFVFFLIFLFRESYFVVI